MADETQENKDEVTPLQINVGLYNNHVAIVLDKPVNAIVLTANEAIDLGNSLKKLARKITPLKLNRVSRVRPDRCADEG